MVSSSYIFVTEASSVTGANLKRLLRLKKSMFPLEDEF